MFFAEDVRKIRENREKLEKTTKVQEFFFLNCVFLRTKIFLVSGVPLGKIVVKWEQLVRLLP